MALALVGRKQVKLASLLQQCTRTYAGHQPGYWNHEWRPGPVPETEQERRAAAKKYGLIPADYKTYPDDGTGFGDYPKLEPFSAEAKDPFGVYDFPELKRNFGEPLHVEADMHGEDRLNVNIKLKYPMSWMIKSFLGVMFGSAVLFMLCENLKYVDVKIMPRHNPFDGKPHYSFDTVEKLD